MFVFTAAAILEEMAAPRARGARPPSAARSRPGAPTSTSFASARDEFAASPEHQPRLCRRGTHTDRAAVVPADLGWSDVGSWGALWDLGEKDADGNVAVGDVLLGGRRATATCAATAS